MKIIIATGASGGHIFPALSVAEVLRQQGHELLFVGVFGSWKQMVLDKDFKIREIPARGLVGKSLTDTLVSIGCMLKSLGVAGKILREYQPDRIIGFGGYGSFPTVLIGSLRGMATTIHEQNAVAGRANRLLGIFVRKVLISFPQSCRFFPSKKVALTGYPLRAFSSDLDRNACLNALGLSDERLTIAVCGGSQGSRTLNYVMVKAAELLKQHKDFQCIHITGPDDQEIVTQGYDRLGITYKVFSFFQDMEKIYRCADVIVARAGAGSIHEIAHFKIPAIIVPYPFAGNHQRQNAVAFVQSGQGIMIEEKHLTAGRICDEIQQLLEAQPTWMKPEFLQHDAAKQIAEQLVDIDHEE